MVGRSGANEEAAGYENGWRIAGTVFAAAVAAVVLILTLVGTLDELPTWFRATAQGTGTLAGIFLGAYLQRHDQQRSARATGRSAMAHLVALAQNVRMLMETASTLRRNLSEQPPQDVQALSYTCDNVLMSVDNHGRAILAQAEAATHAWQPFMPDFAAVARSLTDQSGDEGRVDDGRGKNAE